MVYNLRFNVREKHNTSLGENQAAEKPEMAAVADAQCDVVNDVG